MEQTLELIGGLVMLLVMGYLAYAINRKEPFKRDLGGSDDGGRDDGDGDGDGGGY